MELTLPIRPSTFAYQIWASCLRFPQHAAIWTETIQNLDELEVEEPVVKKNIII